MKDILIFADYPTEANIKDGMYQRIAAIDKEFNGWHKTYVLVSIKRNFKSSHEVLENGELEIYKLNILTSYLRIKSVINKHNNIYIHSLHNYVKINMFSLDKKNVTIDLHGTVPEEMAFNGHKTLAKLFDRLERKLMKQVTNLIYVSEEMKDFYNSKYPFIKNKVNLVKPIYSTNALKAPIKEECDELRKELNINSNDTVFIYSGGIQKWQNIELTLESMSKLHNSNYQFIILSGKPKVIKEIIREKGYNFKRLIIRTVDPSELSNYYAISHYGYMLRDNTTLNRVAAPTKLIEYLYFGLTPIVKYERVGDAYRYGYEYKRFDQDLTNLPPVKSEKNKTIAKKLASLNTEVQVSNLYK